MALLRELALFAGAGGGLLASRLLGWRTVCAVEIDKYCQRVLLQRQRDGFLDKFPIWDDVRTFDGSEWRGRVDVVTAGFPCQPFSEAGKRLGEDDPRNMWPDTARVLGEVRPRHALLENVSDLLVSGYFGRILGDLAEIWCDARWGMFSASATGAPHQRDRIFVVINPNGHDVSTLREGAKQQSTPATSGAGREQSPNTNSAGLEKREGQNASRSWAVEWPDLGRVRWWLSEPAVGRVADGVAHRVDRLRAIGNGQVPIVAVRAWQELGGME